MVKKVDENLQRMLEEAMLGEKMSARCYEVMIKAAESEEDKALIGGLRRDEKKHQLIFADIYEDSTSLSAPQGPVSVSLPKHYHDMLKTLICDELDAIVFYERLAPLLSCQRHQEILLSVINEEKEHARILAALYQRV